MSAGAFEFSELDLKIIDMLKVDGRTSNHAIAEELGVTTSVVATRIRRMEKAKAMKVVAVSDFTAYGYNVLLPIGVDVKGRRANDVAEDLAKLDEVASVQLVSGKHDIELLVTLPGLEAPLAEEARTFGLTGVSVGQGGVTCRGGWPDVWRANIGLRVAVRVLVRIAAFRAMHPAQLDKRARKVNWARFWRPDVPV